MKKVLITGATGNIGRAVIEFVTQYAGLKIIAGGRNITKLKSTFQNLSDIEYLKFDFENKSILKEALKDIDTLFLLRPPHIADIQRVFKPLLTIAKESNVSKVVFLSVQGAEKSKVIPNNKIEKIIRELGFDYIFIRPSYFMQNLTTTLRDEIINKNQITLPSGNGKFNWIDTQNIGEFTAKMINDFDRYKNQSYEITGKENLDFYQVAEILSKYLKRNIKFKSMNPISFYFKKKNEGVSHDFALVITILHFLPRIQADPKISDNYELHLGKTPRTLSEFVLTNKDLFNNI